MLNTEKKLNKVIKNQCQPFTCNEFFKLLQLFEELFNGTVSTWKTDPVFFELKRDTKPICSRPYRVPKVQVEMLKK